MIEGTFNPEDYSKSTVISEPFNWDEVYTSVDCGEWSAGVPCAVQGVLCSQQASDLALSWAQG